MSVPAIRPTQPESSGLTARILLVEDHPDTAEIFRLVLMRRGYSVDVAGTRAEAIARLESVRPDLLICDIGLPDGSGVDVLRALRRFSRAPALAVTGYGTEEDRRAHLANGFTMHLTKPFGVGDLFDAVSRLLHKRFNESRVFPSAPFE